MENKKCPTEVVNSISISNKINQSRFLADLRKITTATLLAVCVCLLSLTSIQAQKIGNNVTSSTASSSGTVGLDNQPCVITFAPSRENMELSDPTALAGNIAFGGYDRGGYEYSQQSSVGNYRRIVSVDAGCTLGKQQLEIEVNKLVGQGFEVYAMGAVQPGQVVVMLRQPTLNASISAQVPTDGTTRLDNRQCV